MSDKPVIEVLEDDAEGAGPDFSEPAYNAGDKEHVDQAKRKAGRIAKEQSEFIVTIMAQKAGRAWVYGLLVASHCFNHSFVKGDPCATAFQEGERNMALRILREIQRFAPAQYLMMLEEATRKK